MVKYFEKIKHMEESEKFLQRFFDGQGFCVICSHDDPLDLEYHHIGRKRNAETLIISCCRNCHGRLSRKQRLWPKKSLSYNNSLLLKEAFVLRGLAEAYQELSKKILETHGIY